MSTEQEINVFFQLILHLDLLGNSNKVFCGSHVTLLSSTKLPGYSEKLCNFWYVSLIYEENNLVWDIKCEENRFVYLSLFSFTIICLNGKDSGVI